MPEDQIQLRAVVDTMVDGLVVIDDVGTVYMYNPACQRMFGYAGEEVIGQNVKMLMPPPYRDEHDLYLKTYKETSEPKVIGIGREVMGRRKDGSVFPMELSVGEAWWDGDRRFVGIMRDVSERKAIEEQLRQAQKMHSIGKLTGGVAHDFSNMLAIILGNLKLLEERIEADDDALDCLSDAIDAARRGTGLIQRLLAFARQQTLNPELVDVNALITGLVPMLHRTLSEAVEIRTELTTRLWKTTVDFGQLETTILNLAVNARDAMPRGGTLTIETAKVWLGEEVAGEDADVTPGPYVLLSVSDDGEGMPPEVVEQAFEPFFTTKQVGEGTGLGLSMIYGFVRQSAGHVTIESAVGRGTSVKLYFPRARPQTVRRKVQPKTKAEVGDVEHIVVLVVEDDPGVRRLTTRILKSLGYLVLQAEDGPTALMILDAAPRVDLLLTDMVLPGGMNGARLAKLARERHRNLRTLHMSGYSEEFISANRLSDPDLDIIRKPFQKSELARKVIEVLGKDD